MAVTPASKPKQLKSDPKLKAYRQAASSTLASIHQVLPSAELTRFSNRPVAEVEALQEQIAAVVPAGNIVGLVLGGLTRLRGRTLPADQAKSDVSALMRGIEMLPRHILPNTLYGTFFIGPAAVLAGYQKLLTLAGKDPESAFPDGLWQFYLEFAMREDSARHANETTGFHEALADYAAGLSPEDQLAAWICAVNQIYFQYDDLLYNEWRERVWLSLLEQAAQNANQDRALAFRQLRQAWTAQRPYQRGQDAASDENYAAYRRRRFDKFLQNRLEALLLEQRNWVQTTYALRVDQELGAYQQQMTLLATLEPDRYRENRRFISFWHVRTAIIVEGCYYLLPAYQTDSLGQPVLFEKRALGSPSQVLQTNTQGQVCDLSGRVLEVDRTGRVYDAQSSQTRGYLHPLPFQAVRRHVYAILNHQRQGQGSVARLDDQLMALRRTEQERARKTVRTASLQQELAALKCAPVILNWDEQSMAKPLAELRQAKRGLGDQPLTIFRTTGSMVFDQSHIFFDGVWGMAMAEILTAEAAAWAAYFSILPPIASTSQPPYQLRLAYEPALEKFPPTPTLEVSAETTAINMKALYALRRSLVKRHPDLRPVNTVNDLLILYRCHFGHLYTPSPGLVRRLVELQAQDSPEVMVAHALILEMLAKSQANNPSIMLPMDASGLNPRERLHPTTFRNPFTQLWSKYQSTLAVLKQYQTHQTQAHWSAFNESRYSLLVQLDHFGQLLQAHKRVALEGESPSSAAMRLLAHVPDSLLKLLDEIPRRIDVLNEVIKGEEVFSNVGRVARGSSLSRFISAKDDNENKTLVWGILTDDQEVLHLTLRDFRPHVAALDQIGRLDLARMMVTHYLDSFAQGFNEFVAHLLDILNATATHTSKGATE